MASRIFTRSLLNTKQALSSALSLSTPPSSLSSSNSLLRPLLAQPTLAAVCGSEEQARLTAYSVSTRHYSAFGGLVSGELSDKLKELPGAALVLPDSYKDAKNKCYGGESFINGQAVPFDAKYHDEWLRNNPKAIERNGHNDSQRENMQNRVCQMNNRDLQNPGSNLRGIPPNIMLFCDQPSIRRMLHNMGGGPLQYYMGGGMPQKNMGCNQQYSTAGNLQYNTAQMPPNNVGLRPLSPHLPLYQPQLNSTFSIFHRITGAFLSAMILSFYVIYLKMGLVCFTNEYFYQLLFSSSKLTLISLEISALALAYHIFHGVRHLRTDFSVSLFLGSKRVK